MKTVKSHKTQRFMATVGTVKKRVQKVSAKSSIKKMISDKEYILEQIRLGKPLDKAKLKKKRIELAKTL
jgi:hypothetical protein